MLSQEQDGHKIKKLDQAVQPKVKLRTLKLKEMKLVKEYFTGQDCCRSQVGQEREVKIL